MSSYAPAQKTIRLWADIGDAIHLEQEFEWEDAMSALEQASNYLDTSAAAHMFVEGHLEKIVTLMLEQDPSQLSQTKIKHAEKILGFAVQIITMDLASKEEIDADATLECTNLKALAMIFNCKEPYYGESGLDENKSYVHKQMVNNFRTIGGFTALAMYLENRARVDSTEFPHLEEVHIFLSAIATIFNTMDNNQFIRMSMTTSYGNGSFEDSVLRICQAVMTFMGRACQKILKRHANKTLNQILVDLKLIYRKLVMIRRQDAYTFYKFWRTLALALLTSKALVLRLFGWKQVAYIIEGSSELKFPPREYHVEGAGIHFVNGRYKYIEPLDEDGYGIIGGEAKYEKAIPSTLPESEGGGKTLTIFQDSKQKQWSIALKLKDDHSGNVHYVSYYFHDNNGQEILTVAPSHGWKGLNNSDHPPTSVRSIGLMVPPGKEYDTFDFHLMKWALNNQLIGLTVGPSVNRQEVTRSKPLIKFLVSRYDNKYAPLDSDVQNTLNTSQSLELETTTSESRLNASHILCAWKGISSKTRSKVSSKDYQLLVSLLPSFPDELVVQFLSAIHKSFRDGNLDNKQAIVYDAAEFCVALGSVLPDGIYSNEQKIKSATLTISDALRTELLKLLWMLLTYPKASSLRPFDELNSFVKLLFQELPNGTIKPTQALDLLLSEFYQSSIFFVAEMRRLSLEGFSKLEESKAADLRLCSVMEAIDIAEAQQSAAVKVEDFELAENLVAIIDEYNKEKETLSTKIEANKKRCSEIEPQREEMLSYVTTCFEGLREQLNLFERENDRVMNEKVSSSGAMITETSTRLSGLSLSVAKAQIELLNEEKILAEERRQMDDIITKQIEQTKSVCDNTRSKLESVRNEIDQLRKKLAEKENEEEELSSQVAANDDAIAAARAMHMDEMTLLEIKELSIEEEKNKLEAEKLKILSMEEEHNSKIESHSQQFQYFDGFTNKVASGISLVDRLKLVISNELQGTNDTYTGSKLTEVHEEVLVLQKAVDKSKIRVISTEAMIDDKKKALKKIEQLLLELEKEKRSAVSFKNYRAAGKFSDEMKIVSSRKKLCEEKISDISTNELSFAKEKLKESISELNEKKKVVNKEEKEQNNVFLNQLNVKINALEAAKKKIGVADDSFGYVSSVGADILDEEIAALRHKGKTLGADFHDHEIDNLQKGGSGADRYVLNDDEYSNPDEEDKKMSFSSGLSSACNFSVNSTDDVSWRDLITRLQETKKSLEEAVKMEDYDKAHEIHTLYEALKEEAGHKKKSYLPNV